MGISNHVCTNFPGDPCQFVELLKPSEMFDDLSNNDIFGFYVQIPATRQQHQFYVSENRKWAIWWDGQSKWWSGPFEESGNAAGSAYFLGEDLATQLNKFKSVDFTDGSQELEAIHPTFKLQCTSKSENGSMDPMMDRELKK